MQNISIHWFRQDLRLADNPAFDAAAKAGTILPVYILDDEYAGPDRMGAASRWWLHHALQSLEKSLGGNLSLYIGSPKTILLELAQRHEVKLVSWNRCYEPWRLEQDAVIEETLRAHGIGAESFNASLLWEPWNILKENQTPYRVFSPYYRKGCLKAPEPRKPLPKPEPLVLHNDNTNTTKLSDLDLLPRIRWDKQLEPHWQISEKAAEERLTQFLNQGLGNYKEGRNFPAASNVSRLSPYLHFGQLSPNQVWYAARTKRQDKNVDHFCSELGWREFSYNLLFHNPDLPHANLQSKFDDFPWTDDQSLLELWQRGQTGYPIVDAGMRELWQTGYMHNRVRMIVGSFLVKNLLIHWREGYQWFWDCLVDADLANNSASWQWVAGCGADAAPYFRIFNPVTQGQKFDPDGIYTRQYVPELKNLPNKYLFNPWEAPEPILEAASVQLGHTYPQPIVDLKSSRARALSAFETLKSSKTS